MENLTPEEKLRIYEEEKARLAAVNGKPSRLNLPRLAIPLILVGLALAVAIILLVRWYHGQQERAARAVAGTTTAEKGQGESDQQSEDSDDLTIQGQLKRIQATGGTDLKAVMDHWDQTYTMPMNSYKWIKKNPTAFAGYPIAWEGRVLQIGEEDGFTWARVKLGPTSDQAIYVECNCTTDAVDGTYVFMCGYMAKAYTYTSQAGWKITLPGYAARVIATDKTRKPYDDEFVRRHPKGLKHEDIFKVHPELRN